MLLLPSESQLICDYTGAQPFAAINGTMPIRISRQSRVVDIVEKSLNRHENHRGICRVVSRNMPISILNS